MHADRSSKESCFRPPEKGNKTGGAGGIEPSAQHCLVVKQVDFMEIGARFPSILIWSLDLGFV